MFTKFWHWNNNQLLDSIFKTWLNKSEELNIRNLSMIKARDTFNEKVVIDFNDTIKININDLKAKDDSIDTIN